MSEADEMFKKLGYKKQIYKYSYYKYPYIGYHKHKGEVPFEHCTIIFHLNRKDVYSAKNLDVHDLAAINQKVKELGWLDE